MGSRSIVTIIGAVLAVLLWTFLKETYLAIAAEAAIERLAEWLGMPKPKMIAASTFFFAGHRFRIICGMDSLRDRSKRTTKKIAP